MTDRLPCLGCGHPTPRHRVFCAGCDDSAACERATVIRRALDFVTIGALLFVIPAFAMILGG